MTMKNQVMMKREAQLQTTLTKPKDPLEGGN
jgi:hypothetical protein